ncbi:MAG TPA: glucose-6-phosphate dehydrogenase, partial [Xanthobacteraceae bacterium]|nr:glucose-6-phosphate dehydrogenase [Xanthobacteraceae bacterium]
MAIFGAGGDLTKRLVVPALYNLVRGGMLPDSFAIIGIDHNEMTTQAWCQSLTEMMQGFVRDDGRGGAIDEQAWSWLTGRMHYMRGDFTQAETYGRLE